MTNKLTAQINTIARISLGLVFIYHGLIPKILWLSKTEILLIEAHQLDAVLIAPAAGTFEILLGLSLIFLRKTLMPVYLSLVLLAALLLDVTFMMPSLLTEAFNPLTINLVSMVLGYFIIITQHGIKAN